MSSAIKKVRKSIRQARRQRTQGVNNAQSLYQRGVGDVNYIGAEVGDYLGNMNNQINSGYDQAGSEMSAARAALQTQMSDTTNRNASEASGELQRLGIGAAGLGNFRPDANFAQLVAQQQGTNEQANNTSAKANAGAVGQLLLGMNQGQRQSALGQLLNARNDEVTSIRERYREQRKDSMELINEIRAAQAKARRSRGYGGGGYSSYGGSGGSGGSIYDKNQAAGLEINKYLNGGNNRPTTIKIPHNEWWQKWAFGG